MLFGNVAGPVVGCTAVSSPLAEVPQQLTETVHLRVLEGRCRNVFDLKF